MPSAAREKRVYVNIATRVVGLGIATNSQRWRNSLLHLRGISAYRTADEKRKKFNLGIRCHKVDLYPALDVVRDFVSIFHKLKAPSCLLYTLLHRNALLSLIYSGQRRISRNSHSDNGKYSGWESAIHCLNELAMFGSMIFARSESSLCNLHCLLLICTNLC